MATKWIILSGILLAVSVLSVAMAQETPQGRDCIVCSGPTGAEAEMEQFKGRWVAVCPGKCSEDWRANPDEFFLKMQSRGALFDENATATPEQKANNGWLYFGLYVLTGLIFGAMCAYLAVTQGHGVMGWFFAGLFLNVVGLIAILIKGQGDLSKFPAGVPAGFAKVPLTYTPVACPGCGGENHPSASICSRCGAGLEPTVVAETSKLS